MNSQRRSIIKGLFKRKLVVMAMAVITLFALMALCSPLFAPYDPNEQDLMNMMAPPSSDHLLGTDEFGRDMLSRIVYGSRIVFIVGVGSVLISAGIGCLIGLIAGYCLGAVDAVLMRLMEAMMAIPTIILALALVGIFGSSTAFLTIIIGISNVPTYARMMRGQVLVVRELDYVEASRLGGNGDFKTMIRHILPNCISPILVLISREIGGAVLIESSLSFLGVGIKPPTASWGQMVSAGYAFLTRNPVYAMAPGCAIVLLVLMFNILGDGIRDALDPRVNSNH